MAVTEGLTSNGNQAGTCTGADDDVRNRRWLVAIQQNEIIAVRDVAILTQVVITADPIRIRRLSERHAELSRDWTGARVGQRPRQLLRVTEERVRPRADGKVGIVFARLVQLHALVVVLVPLRHRISERDGIRLEELPIDDCMERVRTEPRVDPLVRCLIQVVDHVRAVWEGVLRHRRLRSLEEEDIIRPTRQVGLTHAAHGDDHFRLTLTGRYGQHNPRVRV